MVFKTFAEYQQFILANPDHPAHEAVRTRELKERRENDPRLRATERGEAWARSSGQSLEAMPTNSSETAIL